MTRRDAKPTGVLLAALLLTGAGCSTEVLLPEQTTTPIDETGGEAVSPDGAARLVFPPGAVDHEVDVGIGIVRNASETGLVSEVFHFEPSGITFDAPVTLVVQVAEGLNGEIAVGRRTASGVVRLEGSVHDPAAGTVTASLSSFSEYGAFRFASFGHHPCEDKACGEGCTYCAPGSDDCYENSEDKFCQLDGVCRPSEPECPEWPRCTEPSPAGCRSHADCGETEICVSDEAQCLPSACSCDESIGYWSCTEDCGGGVCVPGEPCTGPAPSGCESDLDCGEGRRCTTEHDQCIPSDCTCDLTQGIWTCTEDCGGGLCVPEEAPCEGGICAGVLAVSPEVLDFGPVAVGAPQRREVLLTNVGADALDLTGLAVLGSSAFGVVDGPSNASLPPGGQTLLTLEYAPTAEQTDAARLLVYTDSAAAPEVLATVLAGSGRALPPCDYELQPGALSFGRVSPPKHLTRALGLTNVGTGDCLVSVLGLTSRTDPVFTLPDGPRTGIVLGPGQTELLPVDFRPQAYGRFTGAVRLYVSDPAAAHLEVPLTGTSAASEAILAPAHLDFGPVKVGCTSTREVCIHNPGGSTLHLTSLTLEEEGPGGAFVFESVPPGLASTPPGVPVGPDAKVCFSLRYVPADLGAVRAAVWVTFEELLPDGYVITVTGTGAADPVRTDTFVQLEADEADVLFVVDDSGSMLEEQVALGANFDAFISFAENNAIDYRIAVTTMDVEAGGELGQFVPLDGSRPRIVHPGLPDPGAVFEANVVVGSSGAATEKGLEAAYLALGPPLSIEPNTNAGFLREDAHLGIVFVTDEDDQSARPLDLYLDALLSIHGHHRPLRFSASAIAGPAGGCADATASADAATRYLWLQEQTGGAFESICTTEWAITLANIAPAAFGLRSTFFLLAEPVAGTVTVNLRDPGGSTHPAAGYQYDAASNAVRFDPFSVPAPGEIVEVSYEVPCGSAP